MANIKLVIYIGNSALFGAFLLNNLEKSYYKLRSLIIIIIIIIIIKILILIIIIIIRIIIIMFIYPLITIRITSR